ncbi:C40 family peptidase [Leptospira stimsonii]|uniref:NlpC/P60 family protein n=1 Tax=Leptospira stimsonii TaxID=2202203 RepID=A0ABY2MX90_9LEPT|nr:C40 family peptidase [Leptospira stimsonii]TGK20327.1 NlpC/P60 family protein [Leptospira stimsonii]TGM10915.1 NlpC/P60 family protein [Leptospira stimsonii]
MFPSKFVLFFSLCIVTICFAILHGEKKNPDESELQNYFLLQHKISIGSKDSVLLYKEVYRWLGTPYRDYGTDESGIDCSSFTSRILSKVYGSNLSGPSYTMVSRTIPVSKGELKEGDLIFFTISGNRVSHVGIYLKDQKFVHASTRKGVTINSLEEEYYKKYYTSSGRL